jgi:hypothetical protein
MEPAARRRSARRAVLGPNVTGLPTSSGLCSQRHALASCSARNLNPFVRPWGVLAPPGTWLLASSCGVSSDMLKRVYVRQIACQAPREGIYSAVGPSAQDSSKVTVRKARVADRAHPEATAPHQRSGQTNQSWRYVFRGHLGLADQVWTAD